MEKGIITFKRYARSTFSRIFKIAGQQLLVQKCDAIIRLTVLTRLYRRVAE